VSGAKYAAFERCYPLLFEYKYAKQIIRPLDEKETKIIFDE